ncbi:MAG TPA: 50S ribosomal protein L23 [Opitutaceae bacterium]
MVSPDKILKSFRLTEKSNRASSELNQYTFEVYPAANKYTIREAVEQTFKVTVTRVNVANVKGKPTRSRKGLPGYKSDRKKAIVTLKEGDKIELV